MMSSAFSRRLVLASVLSLLFACTGLAHAAAKPDWVEKGTAKAFPAIRYLIGIGSGAGLDAAKESARADLAKQFSVKIEATLETEQSALSVRTDKGTSREDKERTRELVKSKTSETLNGLAISATYTDSKTGLVFALATLERGPAGERLTAAIEEMDTQIATQLARAKAPESDKLTRLRALSTSRRLLVERGVANGQLMVLDLAGQGLPSKVDSVKLGGEIREALGGIRVWLTAPAPLPDAVSNAIKETIGKTGLSLARNEANAELLLNTQLDIALTDRRAESGFFYAEGTLLCELTSLLPDKGAYAIKQAGKDGGKTEEEARRKAVKRLREKLISELVKSLNDYLTPKS